GQANAFFIINYQYVRVHYIPIPFFLSNQVMERLVDTGTIKLLSSRFRDDIFSSEYDIRIKIDCQPTKITCSIFILI
ncbi:MAG: hypothetical protein QNK29_09725, partial [Desulfobacterales bacterium]|nr:hypothetical protein [Desulfobacterales bacterium]MDX2512200.1 hypothetical protein [Desulfobacterales bacterium]